MPKVDLLDMNGKKIGTQELKEEVFGVVVNEFVVADCIIAEQANKRQGTHSTKTRSTVRGGGRKPWRQKGTGRARVGSSRNPVWRGGGVAFGPTPRDYTTKIPRKIKRLAYRSVLTDKVNAGRLIVIDNFKLESIQTKQMISFLEKVAKSDGADDKRRLIITGEYDKNMYFSTRNIPNVEIVPSNCISVFELVKADKIIMSKQAVEKVEEVLSK